MTQALYRKWRPLAWDEVVSQEHIIQTLKNAVAGDRVAHAYLFSGPRGTGKTTAARLLAKAVNCLAEDKAKRPCNECAHCVAVNENRFMDLIEIDAASNTSVEDVRDLRDKINFAPSQGVYKVYVIDECFRYGDLVTLGDGSKMPIGKIVTENLPIDVLSYNERTRQIEPKPVVRWMRKSPSMPTVRIKFDNHRTLVCTINHKFYTPSGLKLACQLEVGNFVYASYERMTQHQLSVVAGAAIGDGHISLTGSKMRARLSITQGFDQKDYLEYKARLLGDLLQSPPVFQNYSTTYSKKGTFRLATRSYSQIAQIHRELYDENKRKRISTEFLARITPLGLALWYLDDGSLITQDNKYTRHADGETSHYPATRSTISTYSFTIEEARKIMRWLEQTWGVQGGVTETAKGPVIWLTLSGTEKLHELIASYVPPSMDYKLLPQYRGKFIFPVDEGTTSELGVSIVREIEEIEPPDFVYNIEVADNHNYFARDILVSNCHMLSVAAFNALLKTLEEPPPHAIFVLATTEIHKIPATILSRCQRHEFRRFPLGEIIRRLADICKAEAIEADPDALTLIARQSSGGMRDAISLLDQLASTGGKITLETAQTVLGTATNQSVIGLVQAIVEKEPAQGLDEIHRALDGGADARALARQVVEYLRGLLLIQLGNGEQVEATADARAQMMNHARVLPTAEVLRMMRAFNAAATDPRGGWSPSLGLELAFAEMLEQPQVAQIEAGSAPKQPAKSPAASQPEHAPARSGPVTSQSPAKSTESAPQASAVSFESVVKAWKQVAHLVKAKDPNAAALLNSGKPLEIREGVLLVAFASDILNEKFNRPENLELTRNALREVLGVNLPAQGLVTGGKNTLPAHVKPDGMVAAASQLGGEIVDVQ